MRHHKRTGFSLIELVIVILILGIIAAIAAPRLFNTVEDAGESATRQQLAILRNAIELARSQDPNLQYPASGQLENALAPLLNGPFPSPQLPGFDGETGVHYDTTTAPPAAVGNSSVAGEGWAYRPSDGSLRLNVPLTSHGGDW